MAGKWDCWIPKAQRVFGLAKDGRYREVWLDLGCGKGFFTVELAKRNPDVLIVGVDVESVCIMRGAELAVQEDVSNVVFVLDENPDLQAMFKEGELDRIYLMFPTPFPQKKKSHFRTTHVNRLLTYRKLLKDSATLVLRTDSNPMFEYSKTQLALAEFQIMWESYDLRADLPGEPAGEYEMKTVAKGAKIHGLEAVPTVNPTLNPEDIVQTAPQSLVDYLPEDLDSLDYIPHGMEGCITNMRNRKANERARAALRNRRNYGK